MIKIVLVDDHAVVREGYRALLARQPDMVVAGEFGDAHSAYQGLREIATDVVVMDLNMPGAGALETLSRMHQRHRGLHSLVFSMYAKARFAEQAFAAGARGYVTKSSEPAVLLRALREVSAGRRFLSADVGTLAAEDSPARSIKSTTSRRTARRTSSMSSRTFNLRFTA